MAKQQRWRRRDPAPVSSGGAPRVSSGPSPEPASEQATGARPAEDVLVEEGRSGAGAGAVGRRRTTADRLRLRLHESTTLSLVLAAHPRQALATGAGLGLAALATDRPLREAAVVAATGLVGQTILGWHNDIVDRERDERHRTPRKPVADGRLDVGTVWFALVVAVLLLVPLSITTGVTAGTYFLASVAVGLLGNVALRRGRFSWLSWAAQFALFAPYLSYGGWGGGAEVAPPETVMVVLLGLLGVGVHVVRAIWGLVADDADGWTYLPLVLGRRMGASRLLAVAATYTGVVLAAIVVVGASVGLRG